MKLSTFEYYKKKFGPYCFYCKGQLYPSNATRDHYFPKSLGGKGSIKFSCVICNKMKANTSPQMYLEQLRKVFFNYYQKEVQKV